MYAFLKMLIFDEHNFIKIVINFFVHFWFNCVMSLNITIEEFQNENKITWKYRIVLNIRGAIEKC